MTLVCTHSLFLTTKCLDCTLQEKVGDFTESNNTGKEESCAANKCTVYTAGGETFTTLVNTEKNTLDEIYRGFIQKIKGDVPGCILRFNKGEMIHKICVTHNGNEKEVSAFLQSKCSDLWKQNIFELREGKPSAKLVGRVTVIKTKGLDGIDFGSSSCLAHIGNSYYVLTVKHIVIKEKGTLQSGPGLRFITVSEHKEYKSMLGYLGPDSEEYLVDVLLIEIDPPESLGKQIHVQEVPPESTVEVCKIGTKTGGTNGRICGKDISSTIGDMGMFYGFFVVGDNFAEFGDSGALVRLGQLNNPGKAIGMVVGIDDDYPTNGSEGQKVALCVPITVQLDMIKKLLNTELVELYEHGPDLNSSALYLGGKSLAST